MRSLHTLLAVVFWALALLAAAPAFPLVYPLAEQWAAFARGGDMPSMSAETSASLTAIVPWLTLAGVLAANATLVRMLSKLDRW